MNLKFAFLITIILAVAVQIGISSPSVHSSLQAQKSCLIIPVNSLGTVDVAQILTNVNKDIRQGRGFVFLTPYFGSRGSHPHFSIGGGAAASQSAAGAAANSGGIRGK